MLAAIGTFWDANETWLVLGIGILLVAFPYAYGGVLRELYFPVTLMLFGLILRGVAFDFRAKSPPGRRVLWTRLFGVGSVLAAWRSEEHTSELQSLMRISYAVFCLEKKQTE